MEILGAVYNLIHPISPNVRTLINPYRFSRSPSGRLSLKCPNKCPLCGVTFSGGSSLDTIFLIGRWVITAAIVFIVARNLIAVRSQMDVARGVWSHFTWKRAALSLLLLCATIAIAFSIPQLLPWTGYGWMHLFSEGGGNVIFAPIASSGDAVSGGAGAGFYAARAFMLLFLVGLAAILPFFAHMEEVAFRRGVHAPGRVALQSLKFGLLHMIVGIPLSAALALAGVGYVYAQLYLRQYRKVRAMGFDEEYCQDQGVLYATVWHTLYNTLAVSLVALALVLEVLLAAMT